ncbi:precorrin-3B synthase [Nonomuraea rubra]|uniref:Precorrin-3B synthase n=1 Tax=Nonomuraea rubra TaxID=46180 RepID=A0A7X0TZC6_9ACTN|nr:precorrin-3B synthase [Nonomuraea rubra]MBB6549358.1 precorrin-3B synthase [Nonomuraea rubra]
MSIADFSGRIRPDACPGALQVHEAADGPLARVRLPGGAASAAQLHALADGAETFGSGVIELTSRANVQVRGLHSPAAFAGHLAAAGLLPSAEHERVRNIVASPLSGRGAGGSLDALALAEALDRALCGLPRLAGLPGRFLFAVDDGSGDVAGLGADVTYAAGICGRPPTREEAGERRLLLAGRDTGLTCGPESAVPLMIAAAEAFLDLRPDGAPRAWRIHELENGPARIAAHLTADPAARALKSAPPAAPPSPEPTAGPAAEPTPQGPAPGPAAEPTAQETTGGRRAGRLVQRDGRVALEVLVPLGRLTPAQVRALADSGPAVRFTPWRTAVSLDLSPAGAERAERALAGAGLITDPASPWAGVTACTGRPGCAKALADVQADARRWVEGLDRAPGTPVHWAGCERRCGLPRGRVVELIATADGYRRQPE